MKNIITFFVLVFTFLPSSALAEDPLLEQPHWSLEVKGGSFTPVLENWSQFYGKRSMPEFAGTLAYKLLRQVEFGVGVGTMRAKGQAYAPIHKNYVGNATYELFPVNAFVLLRGILNEDQRLVPYAGGGFTRIYYREKASGEPTARGHADGYIVRGGLQLSLDFIDRNAQNRMYRDYGVYHTYLFVETEHNRAIVKSVSTDLGGTAYLVGLLFEF